MSYNWILYFQQSCGSLALQSSPELKVILGDATIRGRTDKKLTSTLVIWTCFSFELANIFLKYGSPLFFKKAI